MVGVPASITPFSSACVAIDLKHTLLPISSAIRSTGTTQYKTTPAAASNSSFTSMVMRSCCQVRRHVTNRLHTSHEMPTRMKRGSTPSWCTKSRSVKGFSDLEVAFLEEEIVDEECYLRLLQVSPGDVVVDVGANVGVFGRQAAATVGKHGLVVSVEALPPTFKLLQENRFALQQANASYTGWSTSMPEQHKKLMQKDLKQFVRNLLEDQTSELAQSALARFASLLRAVLPGVFELVLNMYVRWMASGGRQYDVPNRTLSSLFKENKLGPVQLKVDVEGAEVQVLKGLDVHAWQQVQQVVVEAHSDALVDAVTEMLRTHYHTVIVEQGSRTRGTQLRMVYATQPLAA